MRQLANHGETVSGGKATKGFEAPTDEVERESGGVLERNRFVTPGDKTTANTMSLAAYDAAEA